MVNSNKLIEKLWNKRYDIKVVGFEELSLHEEFICKGIFKVLYKKILWLIPLYKRFYFLFDFHKGRKGNIAEIKIIGQSILYKNEEFRNTCCKEHSKAYMLAQFIIKENNFHIWW